MVSGLVVAVEEEVVGRDTGKQGAALHLNNPFCTLELCVMDFSTYYTVVNIFNK